jgi:hypothetical protein
VPDNKHDLSQFGFRSAKPGQSGDSPHCLQCEAMLTDALDGTLATDDQAAFDLHLLSCAACSSMMADAQRGAAWMEMLKTPRPEPPAELLDRIFAQTCGAASSTASTETASPVPSNTLLGHPTVLPHVHAAHTASNILPFRSRIAAGFNLRNIGHTLLQPRLAMTAAMAFFSVALTLNLTGIRITDLRARDLRPSNIKRSLSEANAHVVRYYDNLRVVYELESRVHDLQRSTDSEEIAPATPAAPADSATPPAHQPSDGQQPSTQPDQQDHDKQPSPRPAPGTSQRESPGGNLRYVLADGQRSLFFSAPYLQQPLDASLPSLQLHRPAGPMQEERLA